MKKIISLLVFIIVIVQMTFSQSNTIAKLKFDQAEEAYVNNDYRLAILRLEEAEKLLGAINPKILYLKIVSQNKMIKQTSLLDFTLLAQTRKNCEDYLKNYESVANIEEKYREVFLISSDLNDNYPRSIEEWKKNQEAAEEKTFEEALNEANPTRMEQYLNQYPESENKDQAINFLLANYMEQAEKSIQLHDHDQTKITFEKIMSYSSSKPYGDYRDNYYALVEQEANSLSEADKATKRKYIDSAISYYEELNSGANKNYTSKIQSLKSQSKEWNRKDVQYLMFKTGKELNDLGIEYGSIPNQGIGLSLTLVVAKQLFLDPAEEERFETGLTYSRSYFNLNFTKKIIHPLSTYLGFGYSSYQPIWPDAADPNMGYIPFDIDPIETITLETGFTVCVRPLALSVGASFPFLNEEKKMILGMDQSNKMDVNFGIGFTF